MIIKSFTEDGRRYVVDEYGEKWTRVQYWEHVNPFWSRLLAVIAAIIITFVFNSFFHWNTLSEFWEIAKVALMFGVFLGLYRKFVRWLKG